jgi:signal transduction histidine kinase
MGIIENIKDLVDHSDKDKLLGFYAQKKKKLHHYLRANLKEKRSHPYHRFLLDTRLGRKRVWIYLNSVEDALRGNVETFFTDQKLIGYLRALEGYSVNDILGFMIVFKRALWRVIKEYNSNNRNKKNPLAIEDMSVLHQLSDCSYYLLSRSFMETSKQIIDRQAKQLQALQRYSAEIVSIFEEEKIWTFATHGVYDIFNLYGTVLVANENESDLHGWASVQMVGSRISREIQNKLIKRITSQFQTQTIDSNGNLTQFRDIFKEDFYKIICKAIKSRNGKILGFLFVHDQDRHFLLTDFDAGILEHFVYFTASVLANCHMTRELGHNQVELAELAGRLITIQEEERKKISADVHDTIAQALSGIGYKAILCRKIAKRDLSRLDFELNRLTHDVNEALKRTRQLIHIIRPPVLDEIGIIPALKKLINNFNEEVDMDISYYFPAEIRINPDKKISLFRILQEALQNIKKHSTAKSVRVCLRATNDNGVFLDVVDDGKGFEIKKRKESGINKGLGILIMRERARDMGGKIKIESKVGEGCRVSLALPIVD